MVCSNAVIITGGGIRTESRWLTGKQQLTIIITVSGVVCCLHVTITCHAETRGALNYLTSEHQVLRNRIALMEVVDLPFSSCFLSTFSRLVFLKRAGDIKQQQKRGRMNEGPCLLFALNIRRCSSSHRRIPARFRAPVGALSLHRLFFVCLRWLRL